MAYATNADMIVRYDVRTLGDLLVDDTTRLSSAGVTASTVLTALLSEASGRVQAALLKGERYTAADLAALTGDSLEMLKGITCRICYWLVWRRKPNLRGSQDALDVEKDAMALLKELSTGESIFPVASVIEAGATEVVQYSVVEMSTHNLVVDRCRGGRFYPARRITDGQ